MSDHKNDYRIERDILGEKEIPNSAYWGIHTARALDNFPYYYSIPSSLKRAFFAVKGLVLKPTTISVFLNHP